MSIKHLITFDLIVNDTDQGCYREARCQVAPHPEEDAEFTAARILAFCHNLKYYPVLGADSFEQGEASVDGHDEYGNLTLWCQVGDISRKTYKMLERLKDGVVTRVYFYKHAQIDRFCALMRGTKENWLSGVQFFYFGDEVIERLTAEGLERRNRWEVTFVENALYIACGDALYEGTLQPLDIWQLYQQALQQEPEDQQSSRA